MAQIEGQAIGLSLLLSIVSCIGQDAGFEHRNRLHLFIGSGEAPVGQVEVTGLLDQALPFDRVAPIALTLAQLSNCLFNRGTDLPSLPHGGLGLDHAMAEQRKNARKLLLALRLSTENTSRLLGFTAPLSMPVDHSRGDQLFDLVVGIPSGAGGELVQPFPQSRDRAVNDVAGQIQQPQRVCLQVVGQAQRIAQRLCGVLITACTHCNSSYCLEDCRQLESPIQ